MLSVKVESGGAGEFIRDNGCMVIIDSLSKDYPMGSTSVSVLKEINLRILQGEFVVIVGPSGSGKSTLLNLIGTLDTPTEGKIVIDGVDTGDLKGDRLARLRREKIGIVFQMFNLIPTLTALENVMMPLLPYRRGLRFNLKDRARELIRDVGMEERSHHLPGQLSGGEQQRVAIARALINQPRLILADEPTGNLDSKSGTDIIQLLSKLNKEIGITVVVATHDLNIASKADKTMLIHDGRITTNLS